MYSRERRQLHARFIRGKRGKGFQSAATRFCFPFFAAYIYIMDLPRSEIGSVHDGCADCRKSVSRSSPPSFRSLCAIERRRRGCRCSWERRTRLKKKKKEKRDKSRVALSRPRCVQHLLSSRIHRIKRIFG